MKKLLTIFSIALIGLSCSLNAQTIIKNETALEACIAEASKYAKDNLTIGQLRKQCQKQNKTVSVLKKRKELEKEALNNPFAILPYKPNYVLPFTYSKISEAPYGDIMQGYKFKDQEAVYQISLKFVAYEDLFIDGLDVQAAFTLKSWWQVYNGDISRPFRETNYQPEIIFNYDKPTTLFGLSVINRSISLTHQSNGQTNILSRSWNRVIGEIAFDSGDIIWSVKSWWRLPEDKKKYIGDPNGDDNPDIEKYLGYGELGLVWKLPHEHNLDILIRNNLRSDNKGAIQLGWSFPLHEHLRAYVEYFNGYGDGLIYYNVHNQRIGFGVKLTDWL